MITKYLKVHKAKHIVKNPEFYDEPDTWLFGNYWIKFDFESEEDIKLPTVNGEGLKFVLNTELSEEEKDFKTLIIKTLQDGTFEAIKSKTEINKEAIVAELNAMDNGLKFIRAFEEELDGKCNKKLQEYIDTKKALRKKLK